MTAAMMKRPWRWHLLPIALLLIQVLAIQAQDKHEGTGATTDISSAPPASETTLPHGLGLSPERKKQDAEAQGQPAVEAARDILRSLKVPVKKRDRPSGFLGHAIYYAKEAFYILFMNSPPIDNNAQPAGEKNKLSPQLKQVVSLLQEAAAQNNPDAIFLLAEMNFYGNFTHPRNYPRAFELYKSLATLEGNSTAQYMVGFMYATGIGGAVERNQGKALLYHTFAAMGGNIRSQMTVAFRRYLGIGTPRNCDQAAYYYKQVADQAMAYYRSGPPGGQILARESYRWSDDEGGVYGEGASVSSSGPNANRDGHHSNSDSSLEDVLEYLDLLSKKGDVKATFTLGKMHYDGSRNMKKNMRKALRYFGLVVKKFWTNDGKIISNHPVGIEKTAAKAAAHIGLMFLRGEGVDQNFAKAMTWFQRGTALGDPMCQHYIGLMYLNGYGVPHDVIKAASYFKAAAEQDFPASETRLGALFLDQGDVATATRYFELAARYRWIEAFYYLAEIAEQGVGKERHCGMATAYYKMVAEEAEVIHSSFHEANTAYENGDKETALVASMMAAEQGYESAQTNVAYLLDEQRSVLPLDSILPRPRNRRPALLRNAALALIYWTRSARQSNIDSLVKMGDYYFHGYGTPPDLEKAFTCYHSAAEGYHSAQAFWNLGWMHENGYATEQDFHMAKRFYDLALETNDEAYLPVKLSLIKLRIRSFWNRITHGKANPIRSEPDANRHRSLKEWIKAFNTYNEEDDEVLNQHKSKHRSDPDAPDNILSEDGAATDNRGETARRNHDSTYYDELDMDIDDDILDSLIILALAATLMVLVYVRQRRGLRGPGQVDGNAAGGGAGAGNGAGQPANNPAGPGGAAAGAQREEDRGLFPPPGDPDFAAWVAGGVGH
ncbi:ubiquitin-protein ligase Sel1/Ubx2 [Blastomyces dermatitidis ER-3]|uniref:Ubiquitin-protein ligase Sel1/Ubx2 n=3 Tax=Blastomyces TaxID=229219 RepID=A0A179V3I5_BLAGS|nr:ubiquitin-protein ligase Sel1/Ubx2 [Blastomyces gilchristii SLH14081]XP_045276671.1 ubiquitin-protein ligase Sel1/Ubx2 [Blastomyces dermatitidis ER-3]EEQ89825.2 ubiquitin-protein ligase Sel1/Ubx2 [Blastomyces dermatitidis ER-3]EGE80861.2 ubiquitin-protein ligase Sel1/Ubx2 [Blastomyces dermatitidis ATCC 18188]OAT13172.1 ubiquitin-protein ligase Sel1/Ubx2 [Blastomyces gilchristii SLH14081]